jgi:hypothetical protein
MKSRLNLTIDTPLLVEVKKVAAKQNTNVSKLVENYFLTLVRPLKKKTLVEILDALPKVNIPENKKLKDLFYEDKMKELNNEQ